MKASFLFIIILFFSFASKAQEKNYLTSGYYSKIYLADSLFLLKDFNNSFQIMDRVFKTKKPLNLFPYNEYETYVQAAYCIGRKLEASEGLQDLISNYGLEWQHIQSNPNFRALAQDVNLTIEIYNQLRKRYEATTFPEIREKLKAMSYADQTYRSRGDYAGNLAKQDSIDAIVIKDLFEIITKIGYPRFNKLGVYPDASFNQTDILAMFLHTDFKLREEVLLPKILKYIENGDCNPEVYGYLYDQMQIYSKKAQKYGSYSSEEILEPVDSLNIRRRSIGLPDYGYKEWRRKFL